MNKLFAVALVALGLGIVPMATGACGSGGSSSGSGGTSGNTSGGNTTSGQNCSSEHVCVNGSCNCGPIVNGNATGKSCTDDTACKMECNVCM